MPDVPFLSDAAYDPHPTDVFALGVLMLVLLMPVPPWPCAVSSERNWKAWISKRTLPKDTTDALSKAGADVALIGSMLDPDASKRPSLDEVRANTWFRSLADL